MTAEKLGLPICEYNPSQVKQAVVGYGKAEKRQVMDMTKDKQKRRMTLSSAAEVCWSGTGVGHNIDIPEFLVDHLGIDLGGRDDLIGQFHPDVMAIEELFFNHNVTTGIGVAQARGVILMTAENR